MKNQGLSLPSQEGSNWAATNGHINVLDWMKDQGLSLPNQEGLKWAATNNYTDVLEWMNKLSDHNVLKLK